MPRAAELPSAASKSSHTASVASRDPALDPSPPVSDDESRPIDRPLEVPSHSIRLTRRPPPPAGQAPFAAKRRTPAIDGPRWAIDRHQPSQKPCCIPKEPAGETGHRQRQGGQGLGSQATQASRALRACENGIRRGPPESGGQHRPSCPRNPAVQAGVQRWEPENRAPGRPAARAAPANAKREPATSTPDRPIQNPDPAPPSCGRAAFFIDAGDQNSDAAEKNSGADIKRPGAAPIKCDLDDQKLETALNKCSLGAKSIEPAARRLDPGSPKRGAAVPERVPEVP